MAQYQPKYAGYEEDIDFHATDPESLAKLHKYNVQDTTFTLWLAQKFYTDLEQTPARRSAALIEAQCLPVVAWAVSYSGIM